MRCRAAGIKEKLQNTLTTSDALPEPVIMYNIVISEYKCVYGGSTHSLAGNTLHMSVCPCFHSLCLLDV